MAKKITNVRGKGLRSASRGASDGVVSSVKALFGGGSAGRWATTQLKKAVMEGRAMSAAALRTLDTLRHEEWKFFDEQLVEEAKIRLVGVADLVQAGLVKTVPNALGKQVFAYEKVTFMDEATVSLDGISRTNHDREEFDLSQIPLPITHKDFFINLRALEASRDKGESLDTMQVRTAGRVVSEKAEKMLFQGGPTFGGLKLYGYTNFIDRNTSGFDGGKSWDDSTKIGSSFLKDVQVGLAALAADRMYGPFFIYVPSAAGINLNADYNAGTANTQTIRQRLEAIDNIAGIHVADQMPAAQVVIVQMTSDNVVWVSGENLQTVQWDEYGGFELNFKAFQIAVPLIRSDAQGRSGIMHFS